MTAFYRTWKQIEANNTLDKSFSYFSMINFNKQDITYYHSNTTPELVCINTVERKRGEINVILFSVTSFYMLSIGI